MESAPPAAGGQARVAFVLAVGQTSRTFSIKATTRNSVGLPLDLNGVARGRRISSGTERFLGLPSHQDRSKYDHDLRIEAQIGDDQAVFRVQGSGFRVQSLKVTAAAASDTASRGDTPLIGLIGSVAVIATPGSRTGERRAEAKQQGTRHLVSPRSVPAADPTTR